MLADESMRLNKYISESGICSRREADRSIEQGNVFINGKRAGVGDQVFAGDLVKVNGQVIEPREACFTRLDNARSSPGNGLGLSLVKAILDLHETKIELNDNQPGLKITLFFPVSPTH